MAKKTPRKLSPPELPPRMDSVRRDEVLEISGFMKRFEIKDKRTAIKVLKALGLEIDPAEDTSFAFLTGEAFFNAVHKHNGGTDN